MNSLDFAHLFGTEFQSYSTFYINRRFGDCIPFGFISKFWFFKIIVGKIESVHKRVSMNQNVGRYRRVNL